MATTIEPPTEPIRPLTRRPAVLRLILIALFAEIGYAVLNISAMQVYLKYDRGFSESIIGLVLVAFLLSEALFKSPMGKLADKMGRKRLIVIGPGLSVFTALATLVVPHGWGALETLTLIALRTLDGLGAAMLWPAAFALMSETVGEKEQQSALSLLNTCYLLGIALALPIGGIVNVVTGSRGASLYLAAGLFAMVSLIAFKTLPSGREHREQHIESKHNEADLSQVVKSVKRIPGYLLLAVVTFMGIGFPMGVMKLFAEAQLKMDEAQFGLLALPAATAMAIMNTPMSKFGDRIGRVKAVHYGMGMCFVGLALIALGAFLPFLRNLAVLAVGGIPVGLGFLIAIPAWYASVADLDPTRRAANIGSIMTAQGVGAIFGLMLGSLGYDKLQAIDPSFGHYSPFIGCAACVGMGWAISLRILREPHETT